MLTNKQIPFVTPIWTSLVSLDDSIANKCMELMKNHPSTSYSNRGGYQSPSFTGKEFLGYFPKVMEATTQTVKDIVKDLGAKDLLLSKAWININGKGDFNIPHVHSNSSFSAVLYIKTSEDCGSLVFKNPTSSEAYPIHDNIPGFLGTYEIKPEDGLFCIFPSYLMHYVEPNKSDNKRISIALNFLQL